MQILQIVTTHFLTFVAQNTIDKNHERITENS